MARTQIVGRLGVDLIARTAKFIEGFRRAEKTQRVFQARVAATAKRVLAYAATYIAVRKLTSEFAQQAREIDNIAKTSRKLGMTTEALSSMQYAASLSGVEVRKLNMGIQRMTRRMAEAAVGTGEARNAIKDLGLDAKELGKLAPDEQFIAVAEAMEKVTNSGQRVRYAFKLFDSEGVDLVNMLNNGADGLRRMYQEADKLGVSITQLQTFKVEAAKDSLTRVGAVLTGLKRSVLVEIAPLIESAADAFVNWATSGGTAGEKVVSAVRSVSLGVGKAMDGVDVLKAGFYGLGGTVNAVGAGLVKWAQYVVDGVAVVGDGIDHLVLSWTQLKAHVLQATADIVAAQYDITGMGGDLLVSYIESANDAAQEFHMQTIGVAEGSAGAGAAIRGVSKDLEQMADALKTSAESGFGEASALIDDVASEKRLKEITKAYDDIQAAADDAAAASIAAHKNAEETKTGLTKEQLKERAALIKSDTSFVIGGLQDIVNNSQMAAEAQFEATKALKFGQTVMNTAAAYMEFMAQGRPGMAKFAVAMGAIQAAAIAGTTYGGGGGVETSAAVAEPAESAAPQRTINFVMAGGSGAPSRDYLVQLVEGLNEVLGDGYALNVSGG